MKNDARTFHTEKTLNRLAVCASILLTLPFGAGLARAAEPPSQPSAQPVSQSAPSRSTVPFQNIMRHAFNPVGPYRGQAVPPPSLENSAHLGMMVRDGKIYLSLRDAIDLALENNLDLVIARYNLPIAQTDILRTAAGASVRGVNTGVVSGTPGGAGAGAGAGTGAGGTSSGAGGAGAGASGIVSSTLGTGTSINSFDPTLSAKIYNDHTSEQLTNFQVEGVSIYKYNTSAANFTYDQAFATGTGVEVTWSNSRETMNGKYDYFSPAYASSMQVYIQQPLLAGFGFGPNLRFLRIARTNQKISDIAFRGQTIATVTQIANIYWDLASAYDNVQVSERSVAFAADTLDKNRKQLEMQAIPEMEVLKAEGELATRQQDLTVARTNLQLQELYMKNAITRTFDDPTLEEMPVVPTDHIATTLEPPAETVQQMIARALRDRTELQESTLDLQNRELSRKTARNALLPTIDLYGMYVGTGAGGERNPKYYDSTTTSDLPTSMGGVMSDVFNGTAPEYRVGVSMSIPLRNRAAKADQYRTELEYRQSQVYLEERKKSIRIEVRNARYALEQGAARVEAARKARDLAQRTLDIMQKELELGAGSNQQTLAAEHDLALASSALVTAETAYEKARIELKRATGSVLEDYGISVAAAITGDVEAGHSK
jgi:outer membrane protein TolC